jgi:hypothetical protein
VKDRLVQTRVPERLQHVLKEEAQKRRLTVSHLIRNMLEDTLQLVDTVVTGAGDIVGDSVDLAENVVRDAGKLATSARDAVRGRDANVAEKTTRRDTGVRPAKTEEGPRSAPPRGRAARLAALDHVLAWNQVVVNRPAHCNGCRRELPRGGSAHLGLSQDPTKPPSWLCSECLEWL